MVAILISAATIASTEVISAGAYSTYGSSTTAYASKSGYEFYKYGYSNYSYTTLTRPSGTNRFVLAQILILKLGKNRKYFVVENSKTGDGVLKKGKYRTAFYIQSSSYRRYWHRGVLNNDTSYSSGAYHVFDYNIYF